MVGTGLPVNLHKAQGDGLMYRACRAQHSIPEQQHNVRDEDAAKAGWGREHFFKREE